MQRHSRSRSVVELLHAVLTLRVVHPVVEFERLTYQEDFLKGDIRAC